MRDIRYVARNYVGIEFRRCPDFFGLNLFEILQLENRFFSFNYQIT